MWQGKPGALAGPGCPDPHQVCPQLLTEKICFRVVNAIFISITAVYAVDVCSQTSEALVADKAHHMIHQVDPDISVINPCVLKGLFPSPEGLNLKSSGYQFWMGSLDGGDVERLTLGMEFLDLLDDPTFLRGDT